MNVSTSQAPEHVLFTDLPSNSESILLAGKPNDHTTKDNMITNSTNVQDFNQDPTATTDSQASR
jgi:hypothetical protein